MNIIKRIAGVLLLALAILFVLRIPKNLNLGGDKMGVHIVADIILAIALGFGALALLKDSSKSKWSKLPHCHYGGIYHTTRLQTAISHQG